MKSVAVMCGMKGVCDDLPEPNPDRVVFVGGGNVEDVIAFRS